MQVLNKILEASMKRIFPFHRNKNTSSNSLFFRLKVKIGHIYVINCVVKGNLKKSKFYNCDLYDSGWKNKTSRGHAQ